MLLSDDDVDDEDDPGGDVQQRGDDLQRERPPVVDRGGVLHVFGAENCNSQENEKCCKYKHIYCFQLLWNQTGVALSIRLTRL